MTNDNGGGDDYVNGGEKVHDDDDVDDDVNDMYCCGLEGTRDVDTSKRVQAMSWNRER